MNQADRTDPGQPEGSAPHHPPHPPSGLPPTAPRRLYREPEEKKLAGVCGGIADYVGLDPTIVRLGLVLLAFASGPAPVIAYVIAAFVVPERPATVPRVASPARWSTESWSTGTQVLVILVALALLGWADLDWWFNAPTVAIGLVALGVWLLMSDRTPTIGHQRIVGGSPDPGSPAPGTGTGTGYEPGLGADPGADAIDDTDAGLAGEKSSPSANAWSAGTATLHGDAYGDVDHAAPDPGVPTDDSVVGAGPQGEVPPPIPPWGTGPAWSPAMQPPLRPTVRRSDRRRGPGLLLFVLALLLIGAGVVSLFAVTDAADLETAKVIAGGLLVIGLGMVLGAWRGNGRPLVFLGIPVVAALVLVDVVNVSFDAGFDEITYRVDSRSDLTRRYELTGGSMTVDLTGLPLGPETRQWPPTLDADMGFGEIVVIVPDDATVEVDARAGLGDIAGGPGSNDGGFDLREEWVLDGEEGGGLVRLDLYVGMGEIEVRRA